MASQETAEGLSAGLQLALSGVRERRARLKSCLDGCLSRLANYQQRVGVVCGRAATLRGLCGHFTFCILVYQLNAYIMSECECV